MIKSILVFAALAVLAGCNDEVKSPLKEHSGAASVVKSETVASNQLQLPGGGVLSLSGNVIKQTSKSNDAGKMNGNLVAFDISASKAEEEVYSELQKSGCTRSVIEERDGFLKVHYYKAKSPVIGGIYQGKESDGQVRSQLNLYWQEP